MVVSLLTIVTRIGNLGWNSDELIQIKLQQFSPLRERCPEDVGGSLMRGD